MSDDSKKLFLLDAFALIYRSYYAFIKNPRMTSTGFNASAVYGFTDTMTNVIKKEQPTHIGVVFDPPGGTFRSEEYKEYKAHREEMPEDIRAALPYIKQVIEAFNVPILEVAGYEADDVVGTLAKKAEKEGFTTYMMTPDKDYAQLISDNIFMYRPGRGGKGPEVWGIKEVQEKFEVESTEQVIDILGLWGDSADNIPGIPGIGEKTAKKLVGQYGSVEGLIEHVDELKGKQKENVENFAEQGLLSKKLATIITDVPIEFKPEELIIEEPNKERCLELFAELEFRTLAKRIFGEEIQLQTKSADSPQMDLFSNGGGEEAAPELVDMQTIEDKKVNYQLLDDEKAIQDLVSQLEQLDNFCFDTETTGLDPLLAELVGLAISWESGTGYYIPFPADHAATTTRIGLFKGVLENENITKTGQNLKYDIKVLKKYSITVKGRLFDTMIAHYLLQPDMKHGMDVLAETYLDYKTISIETLLGKKGKNQLTMRDLEPEKIVSYACEDADITWQLKDVFEPQITDNIKELYDKVEMPLINVLADMENEGIRLDSQMLKDYSAEIGEQIVELGDGIQNMAGAQFNVDSPRQLGEILFDKMQLDAKAKKTKSGQYATSEDVLSKLRDKHEIIPKILSYRMLKKLKSTYVDTLPDLVNPNTGRIHTTYAQAVAATGRLASNNPNLQNIPIRTEEGRYIRKAFVPRDEDHQLLSADYSQIELRIAAVMANDQNMIEAFNSGADIHTSTAAKVFGVTPDAVTREQRSASKAVNFGILYGQSAFGLAQNLGIKRGEAKEIIDSYFEQFSSIKDYISNMQTFARENGYVETIMKRRRYLRDINSSNAVVRGFAERNAINAPIQGSAADIIKIAMIDIHNELNKRGTRSRMLLQVHDELVFDVHKSEAEDIQALVKEKMEGAVSLTVPLDVEMDLADNWLDAH